MPRSLAALPPVLAGWMLDRSTFGWPLIVGGAMKAVHDLLLLAQFRSVVAIHQHMTGEQPRVMFLHYWGIGSTTDLANGLKALARTGK